MVKSRDASGDRPNSRRFGGTRPVGSFTASLAKKAIGKQGFAAASVITDWPQIAGEEYAAVCQPEKLAFPKGKRSDGTLHLRVSGAAVLLIQQLTGHLIERVNAHFGYAAVSRIRMVQAPLRRSGRTPHKPPPPELPEPDRQALAQSLANVEDPALKSVLERLGQAILRRDLAAKKRQEG